MGSSSFPRIANFGIARDTTQGVLYRLQNGEGKGLSRRAVILMLGTNDTERNSTAEIAAQFLGRDRARHHDTGALRCCAERTRVAKKLVQ